MIPNKQDIIVVTNMINIMTGKPKFSYPARQNTDGLVQKKPNETFAHVRVLEEYPVNMPSQVRLKSKIGDTTITLRTLSVNKVRFRVGVVEATGLDSMKIMNGWTSEAMKAYMIETGYGFIKCTPISSEDAKLEKEWQYRKGFSIEMYVTRVYDEIVDIIDGVGIESSATIGESTSDSNVIVKEEL